MPKKVMKKMTKFKFASQNNVIVNCEGVSTTKQASHRLIKIILQN